MDPITKYLWAKTDQKEGWHPLLFHMLDDRYVALQ